MTASGGATAEVTRDGLHLTTPAQPSRVRWQTPVGGRRTIEQITDLRYTTKSISDGDRGSAAPAIRVGLRTEGVDTTLVYESYFNGTVAEGGGWQSWDALAGGNAKWWSEKEPGNLQTNRPWSEWTTVLRGAQVRFVNVGMGTYNEGADAFVNDVTIHVGPSCKTHRWQPKPRPAPDTSCKPTIVHRDTRDVKIRNAADTADTRATVRLTDQGVRVGLPDNDAKAYAFFPADGKKTVPLRELTGARYATIKHDPGDASAAVLPSYQLGVDKNGGDLQPGDFTTLVYVPHLNGGTPRALTSHNAYAGKWWSTRPINGQPTRDVTRHLADIIADNPNAVILYYGLNVGAGNAGADVTFNDLVFAAGGKAKVCAGHRWQTGQDPRWRWPARDRDGWSAAGRWHRR